ncbi:flap endonuclease-1 [Candidatus Woesearchaeota archaeon]|nr:flap endonuclease-1 [Candidatus Woesearchaeota archaeon]
MGINFKDIIIKKEVSFNDLKDKILVIDSFNVLYQFLATIRQRDGTPLMDSKGRVTSHINGLFYRTTRMLQHNLKPCFVFDGKAPELKHREKERRQSLKQEAQKKYEQAKEKEDIAEMKKYAQRTSSLTKDMAEEAKELIKALGLPVIQAPSEGEAQAAHIVKKGDAFAVVSQDYDSLLSGAPKLIQNLTVSERKKLPGKLSFATIKPELIELEHNLNTLGIDNDQLIAVAMLVGTDYNIKGVKGIGPKNALKLVKQHGKDFDKLFEEVKFEENCGLEWTEVYYTFKKMPVIDDYKIEFKSIDEEKIKKLLVDKFDFSEERVQNQLNKLTKKLKSKQQKGLGEFF